MKKLLSLTLAVTMGVSFLVGCSSNGGSGKESSTNKNAGSGKKTDIVMWGSWSGDQVDQLNEQLESFNESQDKYQASYVVQDAMEEKLLTALAGGELPDLLLWDRYNTGAYASKGALMELDDLIEQDNIDLNKFFKPAVDEVTYKDKLYGIPLLVDTRIIFYNKSMFEEAQVNPDSIKTWDDLRDAAIQLTKREGNQLVQAGFSLKDVGLYNIWNKQAGGNLVDNTQSPPVTAFNDEAGLSVLDFWGKLLFEDKVYELGFEDSFGGNGFEAGKVAMTYDGPWALTNLKNAGLDFGVIANPTGPKGDKGAFMGGFSLAMPKNAKNQEGAWEVMKWWTTQPENGVNFAKISGWIPANIEAANDSYFQEDPIYNTFVEVLNFATIRPKTTGYSDVEGLALIPQLQKFEAQEISAEEALKNAQEQGDKIFADFANK